MGMISKHRGQISERRCMHSMALPASSAAGILVSEMKFASFAPSLARGREVEGIISHSDR